MPVVGKSTAVGRKLSPELQLTALTSPANIQYDVSLSLHLSSPSLPPLHLFIFYFGLLYI